MLASLIPDWFWSYGVDAFLTNAQAVITLALDWVVSLVVSLLSVPVAWASSQLGLPAHLPEWVLETVKALITFVDIFVPWTSVVLAARVYFGFVMWTWWIRIAIWAFKIAAPIVVDVFNFLKFW